MPVYFDTALLLKLYVPEPDTPKVIALVGSLPEQIYFTKFHLMEAANALHCKQGRGEISEGELLGALRNMMADYESGIYVTKNIEWDGMIRRTMYFSTRFAATTLCRSLDAMHVALAFEFKASALATTDKRQAALAKAVGLEVLTP